MPKILQFDEAARRGLERGVNALVEGAALVRDAVTWASPEVGTTVTPTTARAGVTDNTVPDSAVIGIDVRAWSAEEQQRVDDLARGWRADAAGLHHLLTEARE